MTMQIGLILNNASASLFEAIRQQPGTAALIGPTAAMIAVLAADIETYVSDRLQRAEQIKSLLQRARDIMPRGCLQEIDHVLARRLTDPADFAFRTVDAHLEALKVALVAVHAWLENAEGSAARGLLDDVWMFLKGDVTYASRNIPGLL